MKLSVADRRYAGEVEVPEPDDVKMVNCAGCGMELLGESCVAWAAAECAPKDYPPVCIRAAGGRPFCGSVCFWELSGLADVKVRPARAKVGRKRRYDDDVKPSQENAIRELEDGQCDW